MAGFRTEFTPEVYESPFFPDGTVNGRVIKHMRLISQMTQAELAKELDVNRMTLNHWENSKRRRIQVKAHRTALLKFTTRVQRTHGSQLERRMWAPGDPIEINDVPEIVLCLVRACPFSNGDLDRLWSLLLRCGMPTKYMAHEIGCTTVELYRWRHGMLPREKYQRMLSSFVDAWTKPPGIGMYDDATLIRYIEEMMEDDERITPNE